MSLPSSVRQLPGVQQLVAPQTNTRASGARSAQVNQPPQPMAFEGTWQSSQFASHGLAPYVSDMYCLGHTPTSELVTAPGAMCLESGLYDELHYGVRPSSRFVIRDIASRFTELVHLRAMVQEVTSDLDLEVAHEVYHWGDDLRCYVALLPDGTVLAVQLYLEDRRCEMLTTPPREDIEAVFQVALTSMYSSSETTAEPQRVRTPLAATVLPISP